jgi:hypothetical protein
MFTKAHHHLPLSGPNESFRPVYLSSILIVAFHLLQGLTGGLVVRALAISLVCLTRGANHEAAPVGPEIVFIIPP